MRRILINLLHQLSSIPIIGSQFEKALGALTGKTRHMPNERGKVVPRKLLIGRIIRAMAFLLVVAVFFVGYKLLITPNSENQPVDIGDTGTRGLQYHGFC